MPLTYSIAYGLIGGIGTFIVLHMGDWFEEALEKIGIMKRRDSNGGSNDNKRGVDDGCYSANELERPDESVKSIEV